MNIIKITILKKILGLFVIGFIIIIIKKHLNKKFTKNSSVHKKLNDVTNKINKLEIKLLATTRPTTYTTRPTTYTTRPTTYTTRPTTYTTTPPLTKHESELVKARAERDRLLDVLRKQRLSYSNHNYNSLQNRLQARIKLNNIKKMENSLKKKYPYPA